MCVCLRMRNLMEDVAICIVTSVSLLGVGELRT